MRLSRNSPVRSAVAISVLVCIFSSVLVSALPQWVWSPDAETGPKNSIGSGKLIFGGQIASDDDKEKTKIQLDDTQARLFLPSLVNAISGGGRPGKTTTRRPVQESSTLSMFPPPTDNAGGGGGSISGQGEGNEEDAACITPPCIGSSIASQAVEQGTNDAMTVTDNNKFDTNGIRQTSNFRQPFGGISGFFTNFLQSLFGGGASTLPASIGGGSGSGGSSGSGSAACTCEDRSRGCFLPAREVGSCNSGTGVRCCANTRNTRTFFPDDENSVSSSNSNSVKTVTRSQLRRGLLKNIVRGSGSVIDDTIDLLLHPFLTREDQHKVATRVLGDE